MTKRTAKADPGLPPEDLMLHPGHLLRRALQAMNLLWDEEVSHTVTSPQFATLNALLASRTAWTSGRSGAGCRSIGRRWPTWCPGSAPRA